MYVRTDKKGGIRAVQVNGRAERCVYGRTDKKVRIRAVQVNCRAERCVYGRTVMKVLYQGCTGFRWG